MTRNKILNKITRKTFLETTKELWNILIGIGKGEIIIFILFYTINMFASLITLKFLLKILYHQNYLGK